VTEIEAGACPASTFVNITSEHRGPTFNALQVGDVVSCELIDDRISGARAIHVVRSGSRA